MAFFKLTTLSVISCLVIVATAKPSDNLQTVDSRTLKSSKPTADLIAASSVAIKKYKAQSVASRSSGSASSRGYGYPYLIAPTLTPAINARADDENDAVVHVAQPKPRGNKLEAAGEPLKKGTHKKYKTPSSYGATRRQGYVDEREISTEKKQRTYQEPKYRNFDELESSFRPRRIDISESYPSYDYSPIRRPPVSPRDPYLSPASGPSDSFYPTVPKVKSFSGYGQRIHDIPPYGAGRYEEPHPYQDNNHNGYVKSSYGGPPKYPSTGPLYQYQADYEIESNKPIVGDIRKRLLDYAGASDLYEGEPDYFQETSRNKHKYGHVANDYYAYGGPGYKNSYRDFPYVESKVRVVKKARL